MSAETVPATTMATLIESGEARPLLAGFALGPTSYAGRWWHIPSDAPHGTGYVPAGREISAEFDQLLERSNRIDAFLAES